MKDMLGLFSVRKGDRELMLTKRKGIADGRPALQMIQLTDSEDESVKLTLNKKKPLRRNFFKRSKPIFCKFENEAGSPCNEYQPPPAHLFPKVTPHTSTTSDKHKAITLTGTQSTDSSSTTGIHEYQPPTFRITALQPSLSVEEVQRACSPSAESDRRSSSSFVQFAFDSGFQRIEELNMFECDETAWATKDTTIKETILKKPKVSTKKKKAKTSIDFPIISAESLAKQDMGFPKEPVMSPSQSVVSLTNATVTGFDDEVPMTYTEDTNNADPFVSLSGVGSDAFSDPFKIAPSVSHGSNELFGTKWVEENLSFPEPKTVSSQDSSSLIESIIRPKKSSSWDLESRKPKNMGTRDPSPRCIHQSNSDNLFDQHLGERFAADEFPEGRVITHVDKKQGSEFILDAHLEDSFGADEFAEGPSLAKMFNESCSDFIFDNHLEERFGADEFLEYPPSNPQPVNEIVINEQTTCIKGLPASAIAASMIFRQTIDVNEEDKPSHFHDLDETGDVDDSNSLFGRYFPDGTPVEVFADRQDAESIVSSLTETASAFHKRSSLDVWGKQAQNVINHWNFAAKKVREEMTPSPLKKSVEFHEGSAKKSVSDELMNMFSP